MYPWFAGAGRSVIFSWHECDDKVVGQSGSMTCIGVWIADFAARFAAGVMKWSVAPESKMA